jgi:Rieske 2Fe-2S family protein
MTSTAKETSEAPASGYTGLRALTYGLPANAYFDATRHAAELSHIWQRRWIYVCRAEELAAPRAFRSFEVGDQRLILVRGDDGRVRAFHNTCRHRGAALCRESEGVLRSGTLVCPYHAWVYDLQGRLQRTSSKRLPEGFDVADFPLYGVHLRDWRGFLFICLAAVAPPFGEDFDAPLERFDAWPLEELRVGHVLEKSIRCNWKIFWENYNECLHCPGVHPKLSQLVPIYGRGLLEEKDDPEWHRHAADPNPRFRGGLRQGAKTWSNSGELSGTAFPDVSAADRKLGAIYLTGLPSMFLVGHADYVRVVRLRPLGPEDTELRVEYLFAAATLAQPGFNPRDVVDFTNGVMTEDAEVCELNQRGLKAAPHRAGVVMPEEYVIGQFHAWIAAQLARD